MSPNLFAYFPMQFFRKMKKIHDKVKTKSLRLSLCSLYCTVRVLFSFPPILMLILYQNPIERQQLYPVNDSKNPPNPPGHSILAIKQLTVVIYFCFIIFNSVIYVNILRAPLFLYFNFLHLFFQIPIFCSSLFYPSISPSLFLALFLSLISLIIFLFFNSLSLFLLHMYLNFFFLFSLSIFSIYLCIYFVYLYILPLACIETLSWFALTYSSYSTLYSSIL